MFSIIEISFKVLPALGGIRCIYFWANFKNGAGNK